MTAVFRTLVIGLTVSLVVGCSGTSGRGSATPDDGNIETPAYVIGAGDQLQINVRNSPDLSVGLPVRPDGRISIPMVRDIQAAGRTTSELADALEDELSEVILNPIVTVIASGFVGTYADRIRIIGQATQPQALAYRRGMTVLDAIIQVGGLTEFAAGNRAKIIRRDKSANEEIIVRLDDLVNEGDLSQNYNLQSGDVLVIPESLF
ncbi:XrtA/PEP-CTERM system exopolysaccharide export protein [Spiribacter vilamensis]|uniref:Polysaccharide export outer membrane protein n=1 Tax=Spiribacter vilamensis TaxID=531306 RepID=A0A4V2GJ02_9GAMM|nr:XrtA/PEP-CTERM system exopolysaccharide export protein [Spiribacter vilamensis]RZU98375.1 polysaccharide export outer membrane protein [Spiribacter vilamensis]TVO60743.1 sugar ABC transporter substrate-binding protein [Spiribacter vilamensis]